MNKKSENMSEIEEVSSEKTFEKSEKCNCWEKVKSQDSEKNEKL